MNAMYTVVILHDVISSLSEVVLSHKVRDVVKSFIMYDRMYTRMYDRMYTVVYNVQLMKRFRVCRSVSQYQ